MTESHHVLHLLVCHKPQLWQMQLQLPGITSWWHQQLCHQVQPEHTSRRVMRLMDNST